MYCDTPHDLHPKTIWPTHWAEHGPYLSKEPPFIITRGTDKFIVWRYDSIYYFKTWFRYHTRWWHFLRPDHATALRAALDWVYRSSPSQEDFSLVKEIVKEYEDRDNQLKAIDVLLGEK